MNQDERYQAGDFFGKPFPELIGFFSTFAKRGKLLDLGCGQGRDAVPLARMGFDVTGLDLSQASIDQLNKQAKEEQLPLIGVCGDIFAYTEFKQADFVLLSNVLHFSDRDFVQETEMVGKIFKGVKAECVIVFCCLDDKDNVYMLNKAIDREQYTTRLADHKFRHTFEERQTGQSAGTEYRMLVVQK